jgi:hypothetical protein
MGNTAKARKSKAWLLGVGLDNEEGHTRVTKGKNFRLLGGSEETHASMQEKAIKLNEQLKRRGKQLDDISQEEFREIAHKIGMPVFDIRRGRASRNDTHK